MVLTGLFVNVNNHSNDIFRFYPRDKAPNLRSKHTKAF